MSLTPPNICWDCEHNRRGSCPVDQRMVHMTCSYKVTNAGVEYGDSPHKKEALKELLKEVDRKKQG